MVDDGGQLVAKTLSEGCSCLYEDIMALKSSSYDVSLERPQ